MVDVPSTFHKERSMELLPLFWIVSAFFTGLTKGAGVLPDGPLIKTVGGKVMFTTTLSPTETPFISVSWRFSSRPIITSDFANTTAPEYEGRITYFPSTGSLELRNLALSDSGEYIVFIITTGGLQNNGNTRLKVYEPVDNVTVTHGSTDLVEFNSSVSLSCSSSGSSLSFLWRNGSSEITASDRVQLTNGGATLTIVNVTRYDEGPYECFVSNLFSSGTSDQTKLNISFGPESINLTITPPQECYGEGSDITLSCSAVSKPSVLFYWFLNGDKLSDIGRELRLTNTQMNQRGNYSCQAFNEKTLRYETSQPSVVCVLALVANVMVTSNSTDLVEFNSSVSLSCSSSGSSLSFLWLNDSSEVTESDRVQLTEGNSTLTIVNVTRYDQGPFKCHVFNSFSNGTSDPVKLTISYGPENINLKISPSQQYYEEGSDIKLSCSAVSTPSALFYWFLNGDKLSDTGPELRLMNIKMNQSGNYSCQAFNNKTLRYETSQLSVITVLEKISGVNITSTNRLIEGNPVNLTCEAAGSVSTRKWMKDGSDLNLADNITLHDENRVLSFHSLKKSDKGKYSCKVSNPINSEEATFNMVVNYGPENIRITGPSEIHLNESLTLTCSAESIPSASYIWTLNGAEIHNSAVFTEIITDLSQSGSYTCRATNNITEKTSVAVHELFVTALPDKSSGCSAGCIAGIVIACLVVCGAVAAAVCYYVYKKKKSRSSNGNTTIAMGQDNTAYSGNQELNYADIKFVRNKDGGTVQLGVQNNSSEYAQVRVHNNAPATSSPPTYDAHQQRMKRLAPQPDANGAQTYAQVRKN
ncbi:carcinoembryonic antigen-related cell adhesion molecule 5-like isoform X1 [Dicentrarchus labrax]|uniref:carcinoembryonic antigen-related cell adhesion molecule 5-like isoform X1 n=1 Tax=Dicentrarchus labrax TaxID=13489 RepID=UPI0021F5871C|nr:carcinoembryonic antigen-related cell adhesion molecule 5-like isoform X1 [Dicentrarchus labrax]